jgi:hypothetical protein
LEPGVFNLLEESSPENFVLDPNLRRPYVEELLLSVDRALTKDIGVKVSYINRKTKKTVTTADLNKTPDWYSPIQITNPITGQPMTVYELDEGAPATTNTYYGNDPRARNDYQGVILELNKRISHNYSLRFSYEYNQIKATAQSTSSMMGYGSWNDPNNSLWDYGLTNNTMHVIKFQGIWHAPLGFIVAANYLGRSGYQYAAYFSYNMGGSQGVLSFYAEKPSSRRLPFLHYFDLKVGKDFNIRQSKLSVFADLYNAPNFNTATSINTNFNSSLFQKVTGIQTAMLAQFGVRVQF